MNTFVKSLFLFSMMTSFVHAQDGLTDRSTGVSFPQTITVDVQGKDHTLEATGVATRKKFFAKVYSVASYMEKPTANFNEILNDNQIKQLTLHWVRNVPSNKIQEGFRESLKNAAGNQAMSGEIDRFVGFFDQSANKGDEHEIRWLPGGTIEVSMEGNKVGSIQDPEFAKTVWMIWFGDKSVVKRNDLVNAVE